MGGGGGGVVRLSCRRDGAGVNLCLSLPDKNSSDSGIGRQGADAAGAENRSVREAETQPAQNIYNKNREQQNPVCCPPLCCRDDEKSLHTARTLVMCNAARHALALRRA